MTIETGPSISEQLIKRHQTLESKLTDSFFVVDNLGTENFITPSNKFNPEGRIPSGLRADVPGNLDRIRGIIDRLNGTVIPAYQDHFTVVDTHIGRLNGIDSTRATIEDLAKKGSFNGAPDTRLLDEAKKLAEAEANEVLSKGVMFFVKAEGQSVERRAKSLEVDRHLPKMVIDERTRIVNKDGKRVEFNKGSVWNILLELSKSPAGILRTELEAALKNLGFEAPYHVSRGIANLRLRFDDDVNKFTLITRSGPLQDSIYTLNADVRFITIVRERQTPGQIFDSRLAALRQLVENPEASLAQINSLLGPSTKTGRVFTPQMVWSALRGAVSAVFIRRVHSVATPEESVFWDELKASIGEQNDRYAHRRALINLRDWYLAHRGEYLPVAKGAGSGKERNKRRRKKGTKKSRQTGKSGKEVGKDPLPENHSIALSIYVAEPTIDLGEIRDLFNKGRTGKSLLHEWNCVRAMVSGASYLKRRVNSGIATTDEADLWVKLRDFTKVEDNDVMKVFYDGITAEYKRQRSEKTSSP